MTAKNPQKQGRILEGRGIFLAGQNIPLPRERVRKKEYDDQARIESLFLGGLQMAGSSHVLQFNLSGKASKMLNKETKNLILKG